MSCLLRSHSAQHSAETRLAEAGILAHEHSQPSCTQCAPTSMYVHVCIFGMFVIAIIPKLHERACNYLYVCIPLSIERGYGEDFNQPNRKF